jgi:hypothetical protein
MKLLQSIQRMLEEIVTYNGNFGDPVVQFVDFEPLVVLKEETNPFLRFGAAIGLLVNFEAAIDNSDLESAIQRKEYYELKVALDKELLSEFPLIAEAAKRAGEGEQVFATSLAAVYTGYIK